MILKSYHVSRVAYTGFQEGTVKFTVSKFKSNFWLFKYIEMSFDKYAKIDVDIVAADIKHLF